MRQFVTAQAMISFEQKEIGMNCFENVFFFRKEKATEYRISLSRK